MTNDLHSDRNGEASQRATWLLPAGEGLPGFLYFAVLTSLVLHGMVVVTAAAWYVPAKAIRAEQGRSSIAVRLSVPSVPQESPPEPKPVTDLPASFLSEFLDAIEIPVRPPRPEDIVPEEPEPAPEPTPVEPPPKEEPDTVPTEQETQVASEASQAAEEQTGAIDDWPRTMASNPAPPYPALAVSQRWEGVVSLRVAVGANGLVQEISVFQSSGYPILDEAALETVRYWRFIPAKRFGVAVRSRVRVPINFNIR